MSKDLYIVRVPRGMPPCQVDDFPAGCLRSRKGALHITPGTVEMTKDELAHIRKHHKDVGRRLIEVQAAGKNPSAAAKFMADEAKAKTAAEAAAKAAADAKAKASRPKPVSMAEESDKGSKRDKRDK